MHKRLFVLLTAVAVLGAGCATKKYVGTEVATAETRVNERVDGVESQVEEAQAKNARQDEQIGELSQTAQEALQRALEAGELAEGKFLFESVLSDDMVKFDFDKADLSPDAKVALDEFAGRLKQEDKNVYIEIQGHTDASGDDAHNMKLGEKRAESVRRYLNMSHGFALHRMSPISYGESAPVADNGSREGRAQNRRVVIVVLE